MLIEDFPPESCVGRLKQLASQLCKGATWGKDLCRARNWSEQQAILSTCANDSSLQTNVL
jgi:hypothetical protein